MEKWPQNLKLIRRDVQLTMTHSQIAACIGKLTSKVYAKDRLLPNGPVARPRPFGEAPNFKANSMLILCCWAVCAGLREHGYWRVGGRQCGHSAHFGFVFLYLRLIGHSTRLVAQCSRQGGVMQLRGCPIDPSLSFLVWRFPRSRAVGLARSWQMARHLAVDSSLISHRNT